MTEHAVLIVGGGPTGLMLAGELALAGVDVAIVERRASQDLPGSRAGGLHARTIEILDQRGIADRFLAEGQVAQVAGFARVSFDISDFPTRHPYGLGLWQNHIERILAGWVDELAVTIYREREVTGFAQDDTGVDVELSDGQSLRAAYLVGCDGGRSVVRKGAGIEFPGWDPTTSALIAEVEMAEEPELGTRQDARGIHGLGRVEYEIRDGEIVWADEGTGQGHGDRPAGRSHRRTHPARSQRGGHLRLRDRLRDAQPHLDLQVHRHDPSGRGLPRETCPAGRRRRTRALPGGRARTQHGVQDALNLGWKLAQVVKGVSPDSLLDTYHDERHPVAARVLRNTMAQVALTRPGDARLDALRDTVC